MSEFNKSQPYDSGEDKTHLVLINAVVMKGDTVLASQRSLDEPHMPGRWTIPGGKVERTPGDVWNVVEKTLFNEVFEETGVRIKERVRLLTNNTFIRSPGHHVVALIFLCEWESGDPQPLEDTIAARWINEEQIEDYDFAPNVDKYLELGFRALKEAKTNK